MSVIFKSPSEYLCISDQPKKSFLLALFGARVFLIKDGDMKARNELINHNFLQMLKTFYLRQNNTLCLLHIQEIYQLIIQAIQHY